MPLPPGYPWLNVNKLFKAFILCEPLCRKVINVIALIFLIRSLGHENSYSYFTAENMVKQLAQNVGTV